MINKKAQSYYLSPWLFVIWTIIGIIIIGAIFIFYSAEADVREAEGKILANRIIDCIIQNGYINQNLFSTDFDIFKECRLDKKIIEESGYYYFSISVHDASSNQLIQQPIKKGNTDFEIQCAIKKTEKQFADCISKNIYAIYNDDKETKEVIVTIATGSNQLGKKI